MTGSTERVFVTGLGAVTASGGSVDETWQSMMTGQSGLTPIDKNEFSGWPDCLIGDIKNYHPASMLPDRKLLKMISRQDVLGIHAVMQAVHHSQLMHYSESLEHDPATLKHFQDTTGIFVGSPGNKYSQQYDFLPLIAKTQDDMRAFAEQLFNEVHPMWLLRILPNNVLAYAGITYGFKGANHNITNHAVGGMQAIIEAYHAIQSGQISRAVVVAYDIATEPQTLYYFQQLGLLSQSTLKSFDAQHDGTVLGEGACAMILESESSVASRQAVAWAEVIGGKTATEAQGLFSTEKEGDELARLMALALQEANVSSDEIDLLVAHANGNPKSDLGEASAIQKVFGSYAVPVTGFKWSTGHTLCAAGMIDTVMAIYALREQCIPGIASLVEPRKECSHLNLCATTRSFEEKADHALVINRGFGSMNACLILKGCNDSI